MGDMIKQQGFYLKMLPSCNDRDTANKEYLFHAGWLGCDWKQDAKQVEVYLQKIKPDWLIVDHYALDKRWENYLRSHYNKLMVIDDLADREHIADILLDQNIVANMLERYQGKVSEKCLMLIGAQYALLQYDYEDAHNKVVPKTGKIENVFIYFGGYDQFNTTGEVLQLVLNLGNEDLNIDVVINSKSAHFDNIKAKVDLNKNVNLYCDLPTLVPLMMRADIAIGGCGGNTWERLCLGLPAIVITLADNQVPTAKEMEEIGLVKYIGERSSICSQDILDVIEPLLQKGLDEVWSRKCYEYVDGLGAKRVAELLTSNDESNFFNEAC